MPPQAPKKAKLSNAVSKKREEPVEEEDKDDLHKQLFVEHAMWHSHKVQWAKTKEEMSMLEKKVKPEKIMLYNVQSRRDKPECHLLDDIIKH